MVTNAVNTGIDYGAYSEAQLFAALNEIQSQKASLDNRERQIREILHTLGAESSESSIVSRIGLDMPTKETIDALNNSHAVLKTHDYVEFEKMIENE